ncbi:MAG: M14 metallopeptidase family protein [Chitinophagaceae bacterium]
MRNFCLLVFQMLMLNLSTLQAQTVPTPKEHFGFNIGDDYKLATYTQTEAFFKKLAVSDRTRLVDIGLTEEGRHQYMLIVSSPDNIRNLEKYKSISQKLAHADSLSDEQAQALAAEGKSVVWIDGGLHATEVVGTHQLIETMYQVVTRKDPETIQILDKVIILFTHANPDGQELVSDWYMRDPDSTKRKTNIPRLYEKYIGHDNNRDFFMMNMKETQNISRQQYVEWMPQIIYNHHQSGPPGSILAGPPYRDPFNYVFDPLLITSIDAVGAAMNNRLNREGKPGYTQRSGSSYSTWWNGGLRTTPYFHNIIGLLTEIIGGPTPSEVPLVPQRLIPNMATPNPVTPRKWHFRQSIDYSVSLNYAVLKYALQMREDLLFGIYRMGKNSIALGNRDYWALSPKAVDSINNAYRKDQRTARAAETGTPSSEGIRLGTLDSIPLKYFDIVLKDKTLRDPRGYIIPADQPDFYTAARFINALIRSGIQVHKASAAFTVAGKNYPAGSFVVKTAQAFRPHLLDMFEPQDHPNDFLYPGGPPIRPYDAAGWTLAYEMGVKFDRLLDSFEGPFQAIPYGEIQSPKGAVTGSSSLAGYLLSPRENNGFIAVNDLLKAKIEVYRVPGGNKGKNEAGSFFVAKAGKAILEKSAAEFGLKVTGTSVRPADLMKVSPSRIAIWNNYGGSIPSGWVRWLMEQYHFQAQQIYPQEINAGNLRQKYDVIIFVTGAIPPVGRTPPTSRGGFAENPKPSEIPAEFRSWLGRISADTSIPQLKKFLQAGGNIISIGSSTNLAYHLGLPVRNALVEMTANAQERPLPGEKYYIPGSILRISIDSTQPAVWGMESTADVYFDASPVFNLAPASIANGEVVPLAWFATKKPLRSGWAWGQEYLQDGIAAFMAAVGPGKFYAFGPEITFRGQTHGTFKLLFNQLYANTRTKN